jgi:hypothetical protein
MANLFLMSSKKEEKYLGTVRVSPTETTILFKRGKPIIVKAKTKEEAREKIFKELEPYGEAMGGKKGYLIIPKIFAELIEREKKILKEY